MESSESSNGRLLRQRCITTPLGAYGRFDISSIRASASANCKYARGAPLNAGNTNVSLESAKKNVPGEQLRYEQVLQQIANMPVVRP